MNNDKCCEWCGRSTSSYFYRFIIEPEYLIYLNSPHVRHIDRGQQLVTLHNGTLLDYTVEQPDRTALAFKEAIPHIFCSEKCEDNFLYLHSATTRSDIHEVTAFVSFKKDGFYIPLSVPIENLRYKESTCIVCGNVFPNVSKRFQVFPIRSWFAEAGSLDTGPKRDYAMVFTDMTPEKRQGMFYYIDSVNPIKPDPREVSFCSNECVFSYAVKGPFVIVYKNNILKGFSTAVSPATVAINHGLGNPYKYRPQNLQL